MAKIRKNIVIEFSVVLTLQEDEVNALDALVGYGTQSFLDVFYEKMGRAYLEQHEAGLRSLFDSIRSQVVPAIGQIDTARKAIAEF